MNELLGKTIDCGDNRLDRVKIKIKGIGGNWIAGPTMKCNLKIVACTNDTVWAYQIRTQF